jgi:hypothetical protein
LPGFPLFDQDCGARANVRGYNLASNGVLYRERVFESYGCDRLALFQAELRGDLGWGWSPGRGNRSPWDRDWDWSPDFELSPDWAVFFDAGKVWTVQENEDSSAMMDLGVGIYLGDLGLYYAFPLTEDAEGDRSGRFFIRLSQRF